VGSIDGHSLRTALNETVAEKRKTIVFEPGANPLTSKDSTMRVFPWSRNNRASAAVRVSAVVRQEMPFVSAQAMAG